MSNMFGSLRAALLLPFIVVVVLVAASISLLSYITGLKAVDQLSEQLLLDVANRVTQATTRHLEGSAVALNAVAPTLTKRTSPALLSTSSPVALQSMEQRLWIATHLYQEGLAYVYYGASTGEFVGVRRDAQGQVELRIRETGASVRTVYEVSAPPPAARGRVLRSDDYDPRTRPWYAKAAARGGLAWSPVYVDFTSKALTVTLAKPIYDTAKTATAGTTATPAGTLRGVVATDIPLTALTEFVRGLQVSRTGVAFIVERDGTLIATSTAEPLFVGNSAQNTRLRADQSGNALVRQAYAQLVGNSAPLHAQIGGIDVARYTLDSDVTGEVGRVHMSATAQQDAAGLDWTMVVAIPRSDHMQAVRRTVIQNVVMAGLAVLLAIAAGLWIMQRLTGDIRRLSEATRLLARGQSPDRLFAERQDELGVIAKAMEDFKDGLLIDPLTGALTRATFEKRFATYVSAHSEVKLAILFVDLDRFKRINDQHGHAVGDAVLAVCAQRIASVLRKDDWLSRFGGDEFVLMLRGVATESALKKQIDRVMAVLDAPIALSGSQVFARGSCGGALFGRDGQTLDALVKAADARMYSEKRGRIEPTA